MTIPLLEINSLSFSIPAGSDASTGTSAIRSADALLFQMLRRILSLSHSEQSSWAAAPVCNVQPVRHVLSATAHQQRNEPEPDRYLNHIRRYCSTLPGQTPLTFSLQIHHIRKIIYVQANFLDANSLTATRAVCRCQLTGDGLYVVLLA